MNMLELLVQWLTGDFDNQAQIEQERRSNAQIHPGAVHINRVCNSKFKNLPSSFPGFFILEESDYVKPDGSFLLAPHLFLFTVGDNGKVNLESYQLPGTDKTVYRNANESLFFDYQTLEISKGFAGADYEYDPDKGFLLHAVSQLGNGMQFSLIETISQHRLEVLELMEKDGVSFTGYSTPIIYERRQ